MARPKERSYSSIRSILLVDDNKMTNHFHQTLILESGLARQAVAFQDGAEALAYLQEKRQNGPFPEIIMLDLRMPGVDGFAFLEAYYANQYDKQFNSLLVVLSSSQHPSYIERVREISDALYMPKPLNEEELAAIFQIYWQRKASNSTNENDRN